MITTFTPFRKAMTGLACALLLAGCQKEDFMEEQFQQPFAVTSALNGQAIPGQYIVVFKNSGQLGTTQIQELSAAGRRAIVTTRERVLQAAAVDVSALQQSYTGVVNGFAARLTKQQLDDIRQHPDVAFVEQDRVLMLSKPAFAGNSQSNAGGKDKEKVKSNNGKALGKGKQKVENPVEEEPVAPAPTEPAPTEPAPTEPVPTEPAPTEPEPVMPTPVEPAPADPAYATLTPLPGETISWNVASTGYGDGTGKTVWVVDSGIDTDHPDLNIDLGRSKSMIYNIESIEDGFGHGTEVAGIIAAKNNGSGVIGVAANATIVALRVFDDTGYGTLSRAINAVNHVNNYGKPGDVVNMSLGSGVSSILDDAVRAAAAKGILFAIASGNSAVDCSNNSPARVNAPGVYTVSAMDAYQRLWSNSNYGAPVDFAAPGVNVTTTVLGGTFKSGKYGTSFAAPHVAGILLLRGTVYAKGFVTGDKDDSPDPIASVE